MCGGSSAELGSGLRTPDSVWLFPGPVIGLDIAPDS